MTDTAALPQNVVRVSQRTDGIALYFPPLRTPQAALAVGLFGIACLILPLFALSGLLATSQSNAHGLLMFALLGAFMAPLPVFGVVFVGLAVYLPANSLTVEVSPSAIRTVRRVFGIVCNRRELKCADIASLDVQIAAKYQGLFSAEPYFRLVAHHATLRKNDLVVAESLKGEALMTQMQALIARHAGLAAVGVTE